jgi:hypothetical protein
MKTMPTIPSTTRLSRAIEGSSEAVIKGWLWGATPFIIVYIVGYVAALICMIPYVFLAWLLVCLPIYYLPEYKEVFQNRKRCIWYGVLGGPLVLYFLPIALALCLPNIHEFKISLNDLGTFIGVSAIGIPSAMITGAVACGAAFDNRKTYIYEDYHHGTL